VVIFKPNKVHKRSVTCTTNVESPSSSKEILWQPRWHIQPYRTIRGYISYLLPDRTGLYFRHIRA